MKVTVSREADLRSLGKAIIRQAIFDLNDKENPIKALDALLWLSSSDFPIWADLWGVPFADPFVMLASGGARKYKFERKVQGKRKARDL